MMGIGVSELKKTTLLVILVAVWALALAGPAQAGHGGEKAMKKGILLVTFGTSIDRAAKAFDMIDAATKARFPGVAVRWAYTAKIIRDKLAKQGRSIDSPAVALAKMGEEGFTHVAVQSLHVIPGYEFDDLAATAKAFEGLPEGIERISLGQPLIAGPDDMTRLAKAVLADLPAERKKDEAVVFMGHGTHHPAGAAYPAMAYVFKQADPLTVVGTVEGFPEIDQVKAELLAMKVKTAWLIPLMSVAGDHAMNDMAGGEDDSWKSILTKAGIECKPVLKGLAENPQVVDIWLDHLATAYDRLN